MYCEHCCLIFSGDICPACKSRNTRAPKDDDLCFLTEKGYPWSDMLMDVLRQKGIPFLSRGRMGAGLAMKAGPAMESMRLYVSCADLPTASQMVQELFGESAETE